MRKKKLRPPSTILAFASPTALLFCVVLFGFFEFTLLHYVRSPLSIFLVSVIGTSPFTLGWMFSPPDFFRGGLLHAADLYHGNSKQEPDEEDKCKLFLKSIGYKKIILKIGLQFSLLPWIVCGLGFIPLPESWTIFQKKFPLIVSVLFAIGFQWILTLSGIVIVLAIYLKRNWAKIINTHME